VRACVRACTRACVRACGPSFSPLSLSFVCPLCFVRSHVYSSRSFGKQFFCEDVSQNAPPQPKKGYNYHWFRVGDSHLFDVRTLSAHIWSSNDHTAIAVDLKKKLAIKLDSVLIQKFLSTF